MATIDICMFKWDLIHFKIIPTLILNIGEKVYENKHVKKTNKFFDPVVALLWAPTLFD